MRVVACPGCGVKIKIPEGKSGRCACPKCGKALMIKAPETAGPAPAPGAIQTPMRPPLTSQPLPSQSFPSDPFPDLPAVGQFPAFQAAPGNVIAAKPRAAAAAKGAPPLNVFLKRLGIGHGILALVLLLLTGLGMIAEPIAIGAAVIGALSAVVLVAWGRIWVLVIAFQDSTTQGLLALLVPYYWIAYIATRKGRALQPLAVVLSTLVPVVLCLAMVAVFGTRYEGAALSLRPSRSRGVTFPQAKIREAETRIRQAYESSAEQDVLRTVSFQTYSQTRGQVDPAKAERALAGLPGYVAGSFRIDVVQRIAMFQYHGDQQTAGLYALMLPAKAGVSMNLTPTFVEATDLPATSIVQVPTKPARPTVVSPPVINMPTSVTTEVDVVQTVSFQTLGQAAIDSAQAEQVLGGVRGFVAGSFRFDETQQVLTFQYRGSQAAALQYGQTLALKMFITIRLKPTFAEAAQSGQ